MRLLLEVRKITIVVGIVVMLFALITYVDGLLNRTRAKRLVSALQTVRVGTTTLAEIDGLAGRYGGRRRQPCEAELCNVDFSPIQNTLLARAHLAPATRFGATVTLEHGVASYMSVGFDVSSPSRTIASAEVLVFPIGDESAFPAGGGSFNVKTTWGGAFKRGDSDKPWKTIVRMTPAAPIELQKAAFGFDLSCLTRLGGCTDGSELLPGIGHFTRTGQSHMIKFDKSEGVVKRRDFPCVAEQRLRPQRG